MYLVLAAVLGAALHGLKNCSEAPKPVSGDCSDNFVEKKNALPGTWFEAITCFKDGDLIGGTINSVIHDMMIRTKEQELLTFTHDVSSFEYKSYMETV